MLYDEAHPFRVRFIRDEDLVRKFMVGLHDQEARFEIEFNKEPTNIEDAVFHAVSYQQLSRARSGADWRQRKPTRRTTDSSWESRKQAGRSSTGKTGNQLGEDRMSRRREGCMMTRDPFCAKS